jgi:hypothetical protein
MSSFFLIINFKIDLEVDPWTSLESQVGWVGQSYLGNYFFILQIYKNDIILVESFLKKSIGFNKI